MRSIYDFVPAPIVRWPMNDNVATAVVIDEIGSHPGTYRAGAADKNTEDGASLGKINGALDFDLASTEYVQIPDHADFDGTAQIAVSCWAKNDSADLTATEILASKFSITDKKGEWLFGLNAAEKIILYISEDGTLDGGKYWAWTSDSAIAAVNTWHHYLFTFNAGVFKIYVDGVLIDMTDGQSNSGTVMNNDNCPILIGARFTHSGTPTYDYHYNGLIDNVMIFSKALTARQVRRLTDFTGRGSVYGPRPNRIYHGNINSGIFGD